MFRPRQSLRIRGIQAVLPLLLAVLLPASAAAGDDEAPIELPESFKGIYLSEDTWASIRDEKPLAGQGYASVEVAESGIMFDFYQDTRLYVVKDVAAGGSPKAFTVTVLAEHWTDESETWTFSNEGGKHRFTGPQGAYVRLADHMPAAAHLSAESIQTAYLLSRGYLHKGKPWVFLGFQRSGEDPDGASPLDPLMSDLFYTKPDDAESGGGPRLIRESGSVLVSGGLGYTDLLSMHGPDGVKEFDMRGREGKDGALLLVEADTSQGPDPEDVPGGEVYELSAMKQPPYMVLADSLTLRVYPRVGQEAVGTLSNGDAVAVWARTEWFQTVGRVRGPWYLLQSGDTIGWAFSPYLGRRSHPADRLDPTADWEAAAEAVDDAYYGCGAKDGTWICHIRGDHLLFVSPQGGVPRATRARVVLANLNDDKVLDPVFVYERKSGRVVCPILSGGKARYFPAGCGAWAGDAELAISGKDVNGDGKRDLHLGKESALVAHWLPEQGVFDLPDWKQVKEEETTAGAAGDAHDAKEQAAAGKTPERKGCGCATGAGPRGVAKEGSGAPTAAAAAGLLWMLGLRPTRRRA